MKGIVFSQLQLFNYKQQSSYGKVYCQIVAKRKFLCSNFQSLKVLCTKISGLSMFSEIGKVHARKKIPLLEPSMGINVTKIRPHNWLIIPCMINKFEKINSVTHLAGHLTSRHSQCALVNYKLPNLGQFLLKFN